MDDLLEKILGLGKKAVSFAKSSVKPFVKDTVSKVYKFGTALGNAPLSIIDANRNRKSADEAIRYSNDMLQRAKQLREQGNAQRAAEVSRIAQKRMAGESARSDYLIKQAKQGQADVVRGGIDTAKTVIGLPKLATAGGAITAGLGGTIQALIDAYKNKEANGGKMVVTPDAFGKGAAETARMLAVTRFTDPLIGGTAGKITASLPKVAQQIVGRTITGAGNVLEDELLSRLDGVKQGLADRALSFGIGAIASKGGTLDDWTNLKTELKSQLTDLKSKVAVEKIVDEIKVKLEQPRNIKGQFGAILKSDDPFDVKVKKIAATGEKNLADLTPKMRKAVNDYRLTNDVKPPKKIPGFVQNPDNPRQLIREDMLPEGTRAKLPENTKESAFGLMGGFEPEKDENGKIIGYKYNPTRGAIGVGVAAGFTSTKRHLADLGKAMEAPDVDTATKNIAEIANSKLEEALTAITTGGKQAIDDAKGLRAALKKTMYEIVGADPNAGKQEYAVFMGAKQDPQVAPMIDELEGAMASLDNALETAGKPADLPVTGRATKEVVENTLRKAGLDTSKMSIGEDGRITLLSQPKAKSMSVNDIIKKAKGLDVGITPLKDELGQITGVSAEPSLKTLDLIAKRGEAADLKTQAMIDKANAPVVPTVGQKVNDIVAMIKQATDDARAGIVRTDNAVSVEQSAESVAKVAKQQAEEAAKVAKKEYQDWQLQVFKDEKANATTNDLVERMTRSIMDNTRAAGAGAEEVGNLQDIGSLAAGWNTVYRNFKKVYKNAPELYNTVKQVFLDPFDKAKGQMTREMEGWAEALDTQVQKGMGIKAGSKESAAVQQFGEGKITQVDLVAQFGEAKATQIMQADQWFRGAYNKLLDEVNQVRARIYPDNPEKIIPKRDDYYRHFKEMADGFAGLKNIFETPANISSSLAGISADTKPKSKWASFMQKRKGDQTTYDAVSGFVDYIKAAEYAKHIDPHAGKFRALSDDLASSTEESKHLNNFIEYLQDFANDLTGKTNPADRAIQKWIPGGRKTMAALTWLNNRVKANVILGNASSSVAQIFNVPQGIASAGKHSIAGFRDSVANIFDRKTPIDQSDFIKERYASSMFNKFNKSMVENARDAAAWMTGVLDEVGTKFIWNSHYEKALAEGIENPIKYADDTTRHLVGGRGIGEVALAQKAKITQLVAPFQLEVANLWHVMGDMVDQKQFGKLATLFVANYVFNKGAEAIRGSDVAFDPINAVAEAYQAYEEEGGGVRGAMRAGGRIAGEVISNVPMGQTVAAIYPEYGFKIGDTELPTREQFFGDADPTRFGSGLLAAKGLQDPLFNILPSFGGAQIKRTIQGIDTVAQGYSETPSGRVRFPVDQSVGNFLKAAVFGQYSLPEARQYFDTNETPLGEKQSEKFKVMGGDQKYYDKVVADRNKETDKTKMQEKIKKGGIAGDKTVKGDDVDKMAEVYGISDFYVDPSLTGIKKLEHKSKSISEAVKIYDGDGDYADIPEEMKPELYKRMGMEQADIEYHAVASKDTRVKSQYIIEATKEADFTREDLLKTLVMGRKESVGGAMFAANAVLDDLYEGGYITKDERTYLKKLKIGEDGKPVVGSAGTGGTGGATKAEIKAIVKELQSPPKISKYDVAPLKQSDYLDTTPKSTSFADTKLSEIKMPKAQQVNTQDLLTNIKAPGSSIDKAKQIIASMRAGGKIASPGLKLSKSTYRPS